jgi:hypothetical protein
MDIGKKETITLGPLENTEWQGHVPAEVDLSHLAYTWSPNTASSFDLSSYGIEAIDAGQYQSSMASTQVYVSPNTQGHTWTTNGTTGINYPWNNNATLNVGSSGVLELKGENPDIKVNGESLLETLRSLQERLNWLVPNTELEKEWDELRELGERYRELEKQCAEKADMWTKLKSMPPVKLDR